MIYIPFSALILTLTLSLLISGCQTLQPKQDSVSSTNVYPLDIASAIEINQALLVDETADVVHPIADIDLILSDNDVNNNDEADLWHEIRTKLTFDVPEKKSLRSQRNWYAKHQTYLDRVAKRAEPFLYYIVKELEKHNMPVELALLPIVESAFDPFAYSHGRASGMWQFVPNTGKRFGMKQNWWYDGRRDVIASTEGAIAYLKYLHNYFDGDWLLALAAYNSGEGRVRRAMKSNARRNKPTDFWSLNLPKETRDYVPKLLALVDIIKRPKDFNITLYKIENKSVIGQVAIGSQLDLAKAANLAELTLPELQRLNPGFNRWSTDPDGPHRLVIPNNKRESFIEGLSKLSQKERLAWQRYKIKRGDNLGEIATKFNTSIALIKQANNVNGTQIRAGKFLLIPVAAQSLDHYILSKNQRLAKKQNRQRSGIKTTHIVKTGDTLWDLSQHYKVKSKSIAQWNGMAPIDYITPGQKLVIWQPGASIKFSGVNVENAIMRNITYKVRRGDSFARIADKFNLLIKDIERWNSISRNNYLQPGQLLKLSVDVTNNI